MSQDQAVLAVAAIPALTLAAGGGALLPTRARVAGALAIAAATGWLGGLGAYAGGHHALGRALMTAALMLPGALALAAYPRLRVAHAADYCALTAVTAAGGLSLVWGESGDALSAWAFTSMLVVVAHAWWRFEQAGEADREALLWVALPLIVTTVVSVFAAFLSPPLTSATIGALGYAAVGPAMAIGVRRPRITDVRGLVVRVVVLGIVAIVYVALFVGATSALELAGVDDPPVGLLAVIGALAAATFHPLQVLLRSGIDEMLFGDRPDPLDAATRVVDRVGDDPVLTLRAIREAMVLPYASIRAGGVELASSGQAPVTTHTLSLRLGEDQVGEIVIGLRPGDLRLAADDERVLRLVAPLLAQTLRARALAEDLLTSRGQAIAAIEEERRRLRRDLHDGLGPTLSGIAFTADAARNSLRGSPDEADELLRRLRADAVAAVGEIRRLVYDMRPPALDELGLVPALRQRADHLRTPDGALMSVEVSAPADLPGLPAAVEVAAYRIAMEALTNAARHSGTDSATLLLTMADGRLSVSVSDPGVAGAEWTPGVGLASMRERAAAVGGTVEIRRGSDGCRVDALLPLAVS